MEFVLKYKLAMKYKPASKYILAKQCRNRFQDRQMDTDGVIGQQRMLIPSWHLILPLI